MSHMKYRKRFYLCFMVAIIVLFFHSFPKLDISTWSLLLMTAEESRFLRTWCRIQCAQLDANQLLGPCKVCMRNTTSTCGHRKYSSQATDIKNSYLSWQLIRPAGHFSHLLITTRNSSGCAKSVGGDHWKVTLKGPSILRAFVFDLGNGSYEAVVLPVEAGRYKVDIILVYSLCKGLVNTSWKSRGSRGVLGKIEHYINIPISKEESLLNRLQYHMKFRDCFDSSALHYQATGCSEWRRRCVFLWNGDGTWENVRGELKWRPYIKIDDRPRKVDYRKRGAVRKNGTLWFYGDRHSQIFHSVIHRPLCEKIFKNCEEATTFYRPELQDLTKSSVDSIIELILNSLRLLLRHSMEQSENALILNSNFIGHLPYRSYTVIIDEIAKLLRENSNSSVHVQIVWSTMTSSLPYSHVYNAYTNHKMCDINIPILDIFPLTDSHPRYIHSSTENNTNLEFTFESVERLLEDFFEQTANR